MLGGAGDRSLVQGLKGDATYLVVNGEGALENYGINGAPCCPRSTWRALLIVCWFGG